MQAEMWEGGKRGGGGIKTNKQAREKWGLPKQFSPLMKSSYSFGYENVNAPPPPAPFLAPFFNSMYFSFLYSILPSLSQYHLDRIVRDFHILSPSSSFLFAYWTVCSYQRGEHNAWCDGKVLAQPR